MSDPIRLHDLHDEESSAERALLATSRDDAPPSGARHRALAALGVGGGAALVTTTAAESAHHGRRVASILKVLAVLGGLSVLGTLAYERSSHRTPPIATSVTAGTVQHDIPVPIPTSMTSESSPMPANSAALVPNAEAPAKARAPAPSAKATSADDEIAWIDRAQGALASDPGKARRIVDVYRHDVSPRAYDEEATAIAAEASAKLGDQERATREANAFLATYPTSTYRDRVQAILAKP